MHPMFSAALRDRDLRPRSYPFLAMAMTATALLAGVPDSHAASIEERLSALEKQVADLQTENAELRRELDLIRPTERATETARVAFPEASPLTPEKVRPGGRETGLVIGGFIQAHAETGGAPDARYAGTDARFLLRRARVNVTSTFAEHFEAKIEGEFGANSISAGANLRAQLTDGYVQWERHPAARVRLGQFKTPFGFEQLASDPRNYTIERSFSNDRLTLGRQIGIGLSGDLAGKRFGYAAGVFNGNGVNTGTNDNRDFLAAARLTAVLLERNDASLLRWTAGVNGFTSDDTGNFTGRRTGLGVDTQLVFGPALVQAEWLQNKRDPGLGATTTARGWSVLGVWRFHPRWRGVVRFDTFDSDTTLPATTTDEWTLGLDFLLRDDDLKLSVNYLLGEQPEPLGRDDRLLGRVQVVF